MKQILSTLIAGMFCAATFAQEIASEEVTQLAKITERRMDLHESEPVVFETGVLQNDSSGSWANKFEYGALIEMEVGHGEGSTEATVATIELGTGWQMTDWAHGDLIVLYEDGGAHSMELNQLYLTLGNHKKSPVYLQLGKFYVPFGNFDSFFVSDPVVLELAESLETAALLGFEKGGLSVNLTVFNGDVETDGEDQVENVVLASSYGIENENFSVAFGGAWMRNILDSDGLTGVLEDLGYTYTADDTGGVNLWLTTEYGLFTFIAEYVAVLDEIEVDGISTGYQSESLNLELGCAVTERVEVAGKYEKSGDVADWLAETRYGMVCSCLLAETELCRAGVAVEYLREDFGAGGEDEDLITMQLALEF
jgi:hypothetical protein